VGQRGKFHRWLAIVQAWYLRGPGRPR